MGDGAGKRGRGENLAPADRGQIEAALRDDPLRSDLAIATEVGVTDKTVARARRALVEARVIEETFGRGSSRRAVIRDEERREERDPPVRDFEAEPVVSLDATIRMEIAKAGRVVETRIDVRVQVNPDLRLQGFPGLREAVERLAQKMLKNGELRDKWAMIPKRGERPLPIDW